MNNNKQRNDMSEDKTYNGVFTVNTQKIAEGLWKMIQGHPDASVMAFGMFPADVMNAFDDGLKEKIPDDYVTGRGSQDEVYEEHNDGAQVRSRITKDVCVVILGLAKTAGVLRV
jgi:hypothetical protein